MSARGETLVEVVVALLLLTVGALALAAGIGVAQRARSAAASSALVLAAAEGWLEAWRVGPARGAGTGAERIDLGSWEGDVAWAIDTPAACLEAAGVSVTAVRGAPARVSLSSRRYVESDTACAP